MEGLIILYLICCVLGFFEVDYPNVSGLKYWQHRYDFSDSMFPIFEVFGWVLTLLAFIGFPGILVGLIRAIYKEKKEKAEYAERDRQRKLKISEEYNKVKNSKVVFEIADIIRQKGLTSFAIKRYGVSVDIRSGDFCFYKFSEKGLPYIDIGGMTALRDRLIDILGNEWTGSDFCSADNDFGDTEEDHIYMRFTPKKKEYIPTREW